MERYRDRSGERFNDHQPFNSTPWFAPNDHIPNFPADHHHHHHHHHNHHYNNHHHHHHQHQHHNQQQFQHQPSQQQFQHQPNHQQFQHQHQHHFERFPEHHHQPNIEQNDSFWSNGGHAPNPVRKRGFHPSGRGASPEHTEGGSLAKLYVATVPITVTEEAIRSLFREHGNLVEVILPKDKKTGERHGYCFVKYAMFEEADRAITALHNQYTFPGESCTVKVRYADANRDRLGLLQDKLFVAGLNKHASKKEIEEIFSSYGHVQDIYIIRDEHREQRGSGFVQYSRREMALEAIKGLNGIFTMKGCEMPLIVRFANPKRPRNAEPRGNYAFNNMPSGAHPQELAVRSVSHVHDPMAGCITPSASYPVQHVSTNSQPQAVSQWANPEVTASHVTCQSYPPVRQAHSQSTSLPLHQMQTQQESSQSSQQAVSEQKQSPLVPSSSQILAQQDSNAPKIESPQTVSCQPIAATSVAPTVPQRLETVDPEECDWSEHICPDGNKYYYNCVTLESRWNKPEEFMLFEKLQQKRQKLQNPGEKIQSHSTGPIKEQVSQSQEALDHMQIKSETKSKSSQKQVRLSGTSHLITHSD